MQKFQNKATGDEWHFDEGVNVPALNLAVELTIEIIPRPSDKHIWNGHGWDAPQVAPKQNIFVKLLSNCCQTVVRLRGKP